MWSRSPSRTERPALGAGVRAASLGVLAAMAPLAHAGEVSNAVVTLEAISALPGDQVAAALPFRFVLLEGGEVFVGGTNQLLAGRLGKDEATALEALGAMWEEMSTPMAERCQSFRDTSRGQLLFSR